MPEAVAGYACGAYDRAGRVVCTCGGPAVACLPCLPWCGRAGGGGRVCLRGGGVPAGRMISGGVVCTCGALRCDCLPRLPWCGHAGGGGRICLRGGAPAVAYDLRRREWCTGGALRGDCPAVGLAMVRACRRRWQGMLARGWCTCGAYDLRRREWCTCGACGVIACPALCMCLAFLWVLR